jgi:2-methylaconitate cis-trans-isomerase PrpF
VRDDTSKDVFFNAAELSADVNQRDALLLRAVGSPDRYRRHSDEIDSMHHRQ